MEKVLGLKENDLKSGASVYMLRDVPRDGEFEVRGYTSLPGENRLHPDRRTTSQGYPRGQMAWQAELTESRDATLVANVKPSGMFDGGMPGPSKDKVYGDTLRDDFVVRRHFDDPKYEGPPEHGLEYAAPKKTAPSKK